LLSAQFTFKNFLTEFSENLIEKTTTDDIVGVPKPLTDLQRRRKATIRIATLNQDVIRKERR